jgi:hypothetical protein
VVRLLREFVGRPESSSRLLAAQYANSLFGTDHLPSRLICLLAAGDPSADVRVEAERGLSRVTSELERESNPSGDSGDIVEKERPLPPFVAAVRFISVEFDGMGRVLPDAVFATALRFLRHCLGLSAHAYEDDEEYTRACGSQGSRFVLISEYLDGIELQSTMSGEHSAVEIYRVLLERALEPTRASDLQVHT